MPAPNIIYGGLAVLGDNNEDDFDDDNDTDDKYNQCLGGRS